MSLLFPPAVVRHRTCKLPETLVRSRPFRPNRNGNGKGNVFLSFCRGQGLGREISRIACSDRSDDSVSEKILKREQWKIFKEWDVPWDWKITLFVMMPYLLSIALAGIVGSTEVSQPYHDSLQPHLQNTSEVATRLFVDQLLKTAVKLLVLFVFISPYQPFPDDVFSYSRFFGALVATYWCLRHQGINTFNVHSNFLFSTICLLGILGLLAPLCEETIYRGFLMISLTKWLPVPLSVAVSSAVFTLAHQSPGKSTEIFIFGTILGLVYAQTRNLLAPIAMHACWNLGVIVLLTYLQLQGFEIEKYVLWIHHLERHKYQLLPIISAVRRFPLNFRSPTILKFGISKNCNSKGIATEGPVNLSVSGLISTTLHRKWTSICSGKHSTCLLYINELLVFIQKTMFGLLSIH